MKSYYGHVYLPIEDKSERIDSVRLFIDKEEFWIEGGKRLFGNEQYNIICGTFNGLGKVTLIECTMRGTESGAGGNLFKLNVKTIVSKINVNDENELKFSRMNVVMPSLKKWINKTVFKGYLILDKNMSVEYPDTIVLGNFDDFSLEIDFAFSQNLGKETDMEIQEFVQLKIRALYDNLSIWKYLEIYRKLKKFLAFIGVFDKNDDKLELYEKDHKYEGYDALIDMQLYIKPYHFQKSGIDNIKTPDFKDIESQIVKILQKWYLAEQLSDSIDLILEKYYLGKLSRETFFLNSCFAIEIFHRRFRKNEKLPKAAFKKIKNGIIKKLETDEERELFENKLGFANEPSFRDRLEEFKDEFENILPENVKASEYIKTIVNTRNNIVHRSSSKGIFIGLEIYYAAIYIEALTKLLVYRELGFDEQVLSNMFFYTREHTQGMFYLNERLQGVITKD